GSAARSGSPPGVTADRKRGSAARSGSPPGVTADRKRGSAARSGFKPARFGEFAASRFRRVDM
ncbi:enoyl-CoA hydratase family protein, partial [Mycobacterium kansasii]